MKKSFIALAIMVATSGAAMAQSNVEVYGVMDLGFQSYDNGVNRVNGIESGLANGSKLGFKGVEDLGSGLKAGFVLETGFAADTGAESRFTGNWGDQSIVYLQGDTWGKVALGNQFTPLRHSLNVVDPFVTSYAGDARTMIGNGFPTRLKNSVYYTTNSYSGLSAGLIYGAGEVAGSTSSKSTVGFNVNYNQGPIAGTLAYNKLSADKAVLGSSDKKDWLLGGSYDFGVAKAHVGYADHKEDLFKKRNYLVGVSAPVGTSGRVMASYILSDVRNIDNADSKQWAVGYTHNLSKRTNLYTMYSHVSNNDLASVKVVAPGESASTFQAGIRHAF